MSMKNLHQIREISTLSFNERVLQEAEDRRNPLMDRLKFLGIFSSNMDELFKVRVASIQRRIELGKGSMKEVLEVIGHKARELDERFRTAYAGIMAGLAEEGLRILTEHDVAVQPSEVSDWLHDYFQKSVLPHLVPIILTKNQPFPPLRDGALYFGVVMWGKKKRHAILEIPPSLSRFVELPSGDIMYLDDVIRYSLNEIFYIFDYDQIEAFEFKISRDAELDMDNDFSEGHVKKMERVLRQRKGGRPTRLVYDAAIPIGLRKVLLDGLKISNEDTLIPGGRYHNMKDLMGFPNKRPDLSSPKQEVLPHPILDRSRTPIIDLIKEQDLLVTYPYQSFDHVVRLIREAAIDPKVTAMKMTMYRSANNSQIVNALCNGARNGKKVVVNIELQARFDEEHNIEISERLQEVGATVTYGIPPMKVHSKLLVIERRGGSVVGFSTGNFNETTGRLYVDSILMTANKKLVKEANQVFEYLLEASQMRTIQSPKFKHLLVSPFNSRTNITQLIERETKKGEQGYIFLKINHLTDTSMIKSLVTAADAGVKMDLVVRTTYAMRPHTNIRAISILDHYLEHQRIYIFGTGEDRKIYLSSADLMERNLDWRVEVAFPILEPDLQNQITELMAIQVSDTYKARILDETQANHYVGGETNGQRAQIESYRYLQRLWEESNKIEPVTTAPPLEGVLVDD